MNYPVTPKPPRAGNPAITILRILLWLMPAMFIPVSVVIAGMFTDLLSGHDAAAALGFCLLGVVVATAAVGYFDQRIALVQKKIAPPHSKKHMVRSTIIFVLMQTIIAPTVCYAALYGFCVVTGVI